MAPRALKYWVTEKVFKNFEKSYEIGPTAEQMTSRTHILVVKQKKSLKLNLHFEEVRSFPRIIDGDDELKKHSETSHEMQFK